MFLRPREVESACGAHLCCRSVALVVRALEHRYNHGVSRLWHLFLSDGYILVTVNLLRSRSALGGKDFERLASSIARMREEAKGRRPTEQVCARCRRLRWYHEGQQVGGHIRTATKSAHADSRHRQDRSLGKEGKCHGAVVVDHRVPALMGVQQAEL